MMTASGTGAEERARLRAILHGRVQGVNLRRYTRDRAAAMGLTGYVRNLDDGTVEVVAEGARAMLERFEAWLRSGPGLARVSRAEVQWLAPLGLGGEFEVRY